MIAAVVVVVVPVCAFRWSRLDLALTCTCTCRGCVAGYVFVSYFSKWNIQLVPNNNKTHVVFYERMTTLMTLCVCVQPLCGGIMFTRGPSLNVGMCRWQRKPYDTYMLLKTGLVDCIVVKLERIVRIPGDTPSYK